MNNKNMHEIPDKDDNSMVSLFKEAGFFGRLKILFQGIKAPKDSREYKLARIEVQRLAAPFAAVFIPVICVLILAILAVGRVVQVPDSTIDVLVDDPIKEFEKEKQPEQENKEDTLNIATDFKFDSQVDPPIDSSVNEEPRTVIPTSHVGLPVFKGPVGPADIYRPRDGTNRIPIIKIYDPDLVTETAVIRALRWLKKNQNADGSWQQQKTAMTGLALLAFLAHGERPDKSREFGATVQNGIEFLLRAQPSDGKFAGNYHHPIATYALCEAYGMTMNPNIKIAAEKAVQVIIDRQHASGGWDYFNSNDPDRDDTSVMGWAAQALKAAYLANVYTDTAKLNLAMKKSVRGFQKNYKNGGGFGYTAPAASGLSGVGTLCMQLLGAGNKSEVASTLSLMDSWKCSWMAPIVPGDSPQYYFYYVTQAKFHAGDKRWKEWNAAMKSEYVKAQIIISKEQSGYIDPDGKPQEIGSWENKDSHTDRPVMDTCLAALQLMVYYRYLPTTSADAVKTGADVVELVATDDGDIRVNTGNL